MLRNVHTRGTESQETAHTKYIIMLPGEGHNHEAQISRAERNDGITKTRLFKYIDNFTSKNGKFSDKNLIFFIFLLKT